MQEITFTQGKKSPFSEFYTYNTQIYNASHHSFVRQQLHEKKIDEFFLTDVDAPQKRKSIFAVIGAFLGVAIPLAICAKKQKPELKLDSFKNFGKFIDIDYGIKEILATGLGGVVGGLLGGLADRKEPRKLDKIEEATFQIMNITFPSVLTDASLKLCAKNKYLNNALAKGAFILASIFVGVGSAVKGANMIDDKFFDIYCHDTDRKFHKKDLIVHIDDLFGTLVLAKVPLADKLHFNKILPLVYTWSGYSVGEH